ncbi:MAG: signal peptidase I [Coriobacteriia bacterium]
MGESPHLDPGPIDEVRTRAGEAPVSFFRWLAELVVVVATAFLLASAIKTYVVQPFVIPSGSMEPTLEIGDRVLVNKFVYRFSTPSPGDIVVFRRPASDVDYIKRVIAVGGQTVDVRNGAVFVDGRRLTERYIHGASTDPGSVGLPLLVPEGSVFLMGDNRTNSQDSRWFGAQTRSAVLGRAFVVYWPLADGRVL